MGQWKDEVESWLSCPTREPPSQDDLSWGQHVFTVWNRILGRDGIPIDTDDNLLCPYHWSTPVHALNCEIVWPPALDEPRYTHLTIDPDTADCCGLDEPSSEEFDSGEDYLQLDTPEYSGAIAKQWIVEKLLAQGGVRLAGVLNYLFADLEGGSDIQRRLTIVKV